MDFNFYTEKENLNFTEDGLNILTNKRPNRGKFKSFIDEYGNNIYHYLSLSDNPIENYSIWKNKIKNENFNLLNNKGLSFIHYLYLNGKIKSADYFRHEFSEYLNINFDNLFLISSIQSDENFIKKILSDEKIDINYIDKNNENGIKYITLFHSLDLLETALDKGANPNVKDYFGKTALHYAAEMYDMDRYQILEDFYASDNIKCDIGQKTPFQILERAKNRNIEEIERMKKRWANDRKKILSIFSK